MIVIDFETAVDTLEQVVAGNEELVYKKREGTALCSYAVGQNTPGCGVGQVFRRLGVSEENLIKLDQIGDVAALYSHAQDIVSFADSRTVKFLDQFQFKQDMGVPWGQALARAKEEVEDD